MAQAYLSKSVTAPSTGITAPVWAVDSWRTRSNVDPTKITIVASVVGYISLAAFTSGLSPVSNMRHVYRLKLENFPTGTDMTAISLTDIYNAILSYATSNTTDPLNGAVLSSL